MALWEVHGNPHGKFTHFMDPDISSWRDCEKEPGCSQNSEEIHGNPSVKSKHFMDPEISSYMTKIARDSMV